MGRRALGGVSHAYRAQFCDVGEETGNDFGRLACSLDVAVILVFFAAAHRFFHCFHT